MRKRALRSRRTAPAKVSGKKGLASRGLSANLVSRDVQARVVAEAERSAKTRALSANRGLSSLASESPPLIFGSARRRRGRGGAWRDAKCCGAGDNFSSVKRSAGIPAHGKGWSAGAPSVER